MIICGDEITSLCERGERETKERPLLSSPLNRCPWGMSCQSLLKRESLCSEMPNVVQQRMSEFGCIYFSKSRINNVFGGNDFDSLICVCWASNSMRLSNIS